MSINKLVATLEKEASDKENALLSDARKEASDIQNNAEKIASDIELQIARITKESGERIKLIRSGEIMIKNRYLSASIENLYITEIFGRCRELFSEFMVKEEFTDIVISELSKIKTELKEIGEIKADPVTASILKRLKVSEKVVVDENSDYGFTAVTPGGKITVINTFKINLEKLWGEVSSEFVSKIGDAIDDKH